MFPSIYPVRPWCHFLGNSPINGQLIVINGGIMTIYGYCLYDLYGFLMENQRPFHREIICLITWQLYV